MKNIKVLTKSFLAGIMLSIGCLAYLLSENIIIGCILFCVGLFIIVENGYNLFTAKIGYLVNNKKEYWKELLITLGGNIVGSLMCGFLLILTRLNETVGTKVLDLANTTISEAWYSILILSFFSGVLMYLSVNLYKVLNDTSKYIALFLCLIVLVLLGLEDSIANIFVYSFSNAWSFKALLSIVLMLIGNSVGSLFIAALHNLIKIK